MENEDTVTGQEFVDEPDICLFGEEGPKTTVTVPSPRYIPLPSGVLQEFPKSII